MPLINRALGMAGVADVVEFRETPDGLHPYPFEYKSGKPKQHRADEVQLCAQALCLEEMLDTRIPEGALFYGKTRRRRIVAFDTDLRTLTVETVQHIRRMIEAGQTPTADYEPRRCDACLLKSRPAWARGLKHQPAITGGRLARSRPAWANRLEQTTIWRLTPMTIRKRRHFGNGSTLPITVPQPCW